MATSTLPFASKPIPHQTLTNGDANGHVAKPKKTKRLSWTLGRKKGKDEAYVADRSGESCAFCMLAGVGMGGMGSFDTCWDAICLQASANCSGTLRIEGLDDTK